MIKPISHVLHSLLLLILIGTYGSIFYYLRKTPSDPAVIAHTATSIATPLPTAAPRLPGTVEVLPDTGWSTIQPGLERRVIQVYDQGQQPVEALHIWRLDQDHFRMDVAFSETPKSLEAWQKETSAALVVNGGYFSVENEVYSPDGLTILNGRARGSSFEGFGGMLAIRGRRAELRWLVERPYDPDEPLQSALQSFPILVRPGGRLGFGPEREDHVSARRTVIAQDREGRILFIVAPQGYFTLHRLSVYLTESDLDLDIALNLDGGGSTGLLAASPLEIIPSRVLPFVILAYAR